MRAFGTIGPAIALLGCAQSPVRVELNFPSEVAFAYSSLARVRVFEVPSDELGICSELLAGLASDDFPSSPVFDSQPTDVCNWLGSASLPEFGAGPHAYLVDVSGIETPARIMRGCVIGEVYPEAPPIRIELHPTNEFPDVDSSRVNSAAVRCGGGS